MLSPIAEKSQTAIAGPVVFAFDVLANLKDTQPNIIQSHLCGLTVPVRENLLGDLALHRSEIFEATHFPTREMFAVTGIDALHAFLDAGRHDEVLRWAPFQAHHIQMYALLGMIRPVSSAE
ncbi:hypothetical protein KDA23_05070 [Candidatus Saccharibacteria bacterium]|nr:hypothetical protein [Candidatus Saccharibacteria bacterium]